MNITQSFRTWAMPICMFLGALMCRWFVVVDSALEGMLTPVFIFTMLFFTFCRVDARKIRFSGMHLWLILFLIVVAPVLFYLLRSFDVVVA